MKWPMRRIIMDVGVVVIVAMGTYSGVYPETVIRAPFEISGQSEVKSVSPTQMSAEHAQVVITDTYYDVNISNILTAMWYFRFWYGAGQVAHAGYFYIQ
ncbi:MAG: hypothetical protein HRT90_07405 [Candidatus Margulisbacteria bacterium]|nr:hypothetical protein [Candidatus Margulisiibacteriota bacterium]